MPAASLGGTIDPVPGRAARRAGSGLVENGRRRRTRQIRPRATMPAVSVGGHDDAVERPHFDLVEEVPGAAGEAHVARRSSVVPREWW